MRADVFALPKHSLETADAPPNNSLQLTRLACGKSKVPSPQECARMSGPVPEPPGS
jgi:hypothetical protein